MKGSIGLPMLLGFRPYGSGLHVQGVRVQGTGFSYEGFTRLWGLRVARVSWDSVGVCCDSGA